MSKNSEIFISEKGVLAERHSEECWGCRLVSGGGLLGIAFYLYNQRNAAKSNSANFLLVSLAIGSAAAGVARLANLPPFRRKTLENEKQ